MRHLSIPIPQPPVGGKPYSRAVQKFSSRNMASSSPEAWREIMMSQDDHQDAPDLVLGLLLEPRPLDRGVVQLRVGVTHLEKEV